MAKYNQKLVKEMSDWVSENGLIDYGGARLMTFLRRFGIDQRTYYRWMKETEFAEAIKKAKEDFKTNLETDIVLSLANAAKGYRFEQVTREYKDAKEFKRTVKIVNVEPNVGAAIFLLTNLAPNKWRNKQRNEIEVSDSDWVGALKQLTDGYDKERNNKQRNNSKGD